MGRLAALVAAGLVAGCATYTSFAGLSSEKKLYAVCDSYFTVLKDELAPRRPEMGETAQRVVTALNGLVFPICLNTATIEDPAGQVGVIQEYLGHAQRLLIDPESADEILVELKKESAT